MSIDPKWVVNLKGKDFPTWPGVLDAATKAGLRSLKTELLQAPTKENAGTAIVIARAEFDDGRIFIDLGDASPANCSAQIATAAIRMASTRAKGRVLRDALNVGQTLLEELPDEEARPPATAGREVRAKHAPVCEWEGCDVTLNSVEMNTSRKYAEEFHGRCLCEVHAKEAARLWKEKAAQKS